MPATSSKAQITTVASYLRAQPKEARLVLKQVRETLAAALPDAEEVVRYQIPGYVVKGRLALSFGGWKKHYAIYPVSAAMFETLGEAFVAAGCVVEKKTLQLSYEKPVPKRLLARFAKLRAREITG